MSVPNVCAAPSRTSYEHDARIWRRRERERARRRACEARVVPERGDAAALVVREELEVVERALPAVEAREHLRPPALLLVAVRELYVRVWQRFIRLREFL